MMILFYFQICCKTSKNFTREGTLPIYKGLMNVFRLETNPIPRGIKPPLLYLQMLFAIMIIYFKQFVIAFPELSS